MDEASGIPCRDDQRRLWPRNRQDLARTKAAHDIHGLWRTRYPAAVVLSFAAWGGLSLNRRGHLQMRSDGVGCWSTVALPGGFARGADHGSNSRPRVPVSPGMARMMMGPSGLSMTPTNAGWRSDLRSRGPRVPRRITEDSDRHSARRRFHPYLLTETRHLRALRGL